MILDENLPVEEKNLKICSKIAKNVLFLNFNCGLMAENVIKSAKNWPEGAV
jgi:hypothetical protein